MKKSVQIRTSPVKYIAFAHKHSHARHASIDNGARYHTYVVCSNWNKQQESDRRRLRCRHGRRANLTGRRGHRRRRRRRHRQFAKQRRKLDGLRPQVVRHCTRPAFGFECSARLSRRNS